MRTLFKILVVVALVAQPALAGAQQAASPFVDEACPNATALGQHLNELNAQAKPSNDQLIATAKQLVDAYRSCAQSYDRDVHGKNSDQSTDYVVAHRMYARLALARSLQRVAAYNAQLGDPAAAKANYDAALKPLDEIESIGGDVGDTMEGSERKLLNEARDLRGTLQSAEKALPASGTAGATRPPAGSPRPSP